MKGDQEAERVGVGSALNPMLWLVGIVAVPSFASLASGKGVIAATVMFLVTVAVALFGFLFLLIFDRDRL
jgi:hypothetical protein